MKILGEVTITVERTILMPDNQAKSLREIRDNCFIYDFNKLRDTKNSDSRKKSGLINKLSKLVNSL